MRKITKLLMDVRSLQLENAKASPARIQEAREFFQYYDHVLSGITPNDTHNQLREVLTTGDFDYALGEWVQRKMWAEYQEQDFMFEPLVEMDTLPNYLPVTRYLDQAGFDDLEYAGVKAPARPGSVDDVTKRQWSVYPWKKQIDFEHQALVNDDLGYFDRTISKMARSARRTLEKYVSRMYTNATSIARLTGLGALYSTTGRLTTARISAARMAFNQRVNTRGERIQVGLDYIVYHTGLADTVATIQNSLLVPELATNASNVVRATFDAIEDPYIAGTAPNLPWYAFSNNIKTLVLARWSGIPAPLILRKRSDMESVTSLLGPGAPVPAVFGDFYSMNIVFQVLDVWGTYIDGTEGNLVDYQGAYYSSGTAP